MSGPQRWWIPEPVTPETRIYRLCYRCGIEVQPSYGKPRQCRDCYDLEHSSRVDEAARMREQGYPTAQIARELGVNRKTIDRWLGPLREAVSA